MFACAFHQRPRHERVGQCSHPACTSSLPCADLPVIDDCCFESTGDPTFDALPKGSARSRAIAIRATMTFGRVGLFIQPA
jgi:hypothetical protein